jgi:hypothetical protein
MVASAINDPPCMKDDVTNALLAAFQDELKERLPSRDLQATLLHLALFIDDDITAEECRHASIRRLVNAVPQSKDKDCGQASAAFLISTRKDLLSKLDCFSNASERNPRKYTSNGSQDDFLELPDASGHDADKSGEGGGGGGQRAFMSAFLTGKTLGSGPGSARKAVFAEGNKLYNNLSLKERAKFIDGGHLATLAKRAGGLPFGQRMLHASAAASSSQSVSRDSEALIANVLVACHSDEHLALISKNATYLPALLDHIKRQHTEQTKQRHETDASRHALVQSWSQAAFEEHRDNFVSYDSTTTGSSLRVIPAGMDDLPFDHSVWVPPSMQMAELLLRDSGPGSNTKYPERGQLFKKLDECWAILNASILQKGVRNLGKVPVIKLKQCALAGFCVCRPSSLPVRFTVAAIRGLLKEWLKKGTELRRLYDRGALCFRIFGGSERPDTSDTFGHFGNGNLKTFHFVVARLLPDRAQYSVRRRRAVTTQRIAVTMDALNDNGFGENFYTVVRYLDFSISWYMTAYRFHSSSEPVDSFIPGEQELEQVLAKESLIWRPRQGKKKNSIRMPVTLGEERNGRDFVGDRWPPIHPEELAPGELEPIHTEIPLYFPDDEVYDFDDGDYAGSGGDSEEVEGNPDDGLGGADDEWYPLVDGDAPSVSVAGSSGDVPSGPGEQSPPPPPPPPDPLVLRPPLPEHARLPRFGGRERTAVPWGPFSISKINAHGVQSGWGANCYKHHDILYPKRKCQKPITYGRDMLPDELCIRKLKEWLLEGFDILENNEVGRSQHVFIGIRDLEPRSTEQLDLALSARWPPAAGHL